MDVTVFEVLSDAHWLRVLWRLKSMRERQHLSRVAGDGLQAVVRDRRWPCVYVVRARRDRVKRAEDRRASPVGAGRVWARPPQPRHR